MLVFSIVIQSLLVAYYLFSGISKIFGAKYWVDMFRNLRLPQWFRIVTGFVQIVGVAALLVGYWFTGAVAWGGAWLGFTMLMAIVAHLRVKDSLGHTAAPLIFAVLNAIILAANAPNMLHPFS